MEDDKRRWWLGRAKGFCAAPTDAGRAKTHTEGGARVLGERTILPAVENIASSGWRAM